MAREARTRESSSSIKREQKRLAVERDAIRGKYERKRPAWDRLFRVEGPGGERDCFETVTPAGLYFELRCIVCAEAARQGVISADSPWAKGRKFANVLQVEDLKRHCNLSNGQLTDKIALDQRHARALQCLGFRHLAASELPQRAQALKCRAAKRERENTSVELPSLKQLSIALELAWGWGGKALRDYPKRCASARAQGASISHTRCSRECGRRLVIAAAEAEYEIDRERIIPEATEICWAQDAAHDIMLMKYQSVNGASYVFDRMVDARRPRGDRAPHIVLDMEAGLDMLCSAPKRARVKLAEASLAAAPDGASAPRPSTSSMASSSSADARAVGSIVPRVVPAATRDAAPAATQGLRRAAAPTSRLRPRAKKPRIKKYKFQVRRVINYTVKRHFRSVCRGANADGARVEQKALRLAKLKGLFSKLDFITRAEEHSCALVLKNAVQDCKWLDKACLCLILRAPAS